MRLKERPLMELVAFSKKAPLVMRKPYNYLLQGREASLKLGSG